MMASTCPGGIITYMGSSLAAKSWGTIIVSSKYAAVVIIIMVALILTGLGLTSVQAETDVVTDIEYSPDPAVTNETFEVSARLTNETDVESVVLTICTDAICFTPIPMERDADGVWRGSSDNIIDLVDHKLNITVHYTDSSKVWTDDIPFDVTEKTNGDNGDDDDNGIIPAMGAVAVLAVLTSLAMTRRNKKGK
jgi:hypothetical protein